MRCSAVALLIIFTAATALAQSPTSVKKPRAAAAVKKSVAPEAAAAVKSGPSICVASIVGHRFEVQTIGLTVFGNGLETVDTTSWGLDDLIVRKVGAIAGGRFVVRRLAFKRSALESFEAPQKSIFEGGPLFRDSGKEFLDMLKAASVTAGNCDSYLVIFSNITGYGNTNQYLKGIGILNHDTGILSAQYLFAVLAASIYDGTTFEHRKTERVRTGPAFDLSEALTGPGIHGVVRRVDKTWLPNPPQTAARNLKLRDAAWALIEPALAQTVSAILVQR